ncbi:MAG: alpha/beta hydrolase family protein [Phycisphaeraceae bacterium]
MQKFFVVVLLVLFAQANAAQETDLTSAWYDLGEHRAFLVVPEQSAATELGKPWVWYAPAFDERLPEKRELWMIDRLLAKGIAVAAIDVGESMGNPEGRAAFTELYEHMVARGYSKKPVLLARSRGGLMHYNWAVEHADCVAGIAGIYTVGNLSSWPGLQRAAKAYGMTPEQLRDNLHHHNPVDRIEPLAKSKVPIYHLHGDNDSVVPLKPNAGLLVERYKQHSGPATLEIIEGGGHDLNKHWFESQNLVDFMIERALQSAKS